MDGDTITMNPADGKHIKIVEDRFLTQDQQFEPHANPSQDENREGRYTSFHRRARLRSEIEITSGSPPATVGADSSAVGDVLTPSRNRRLMGYLFGFISSFLYCFFQVGIAAVEVLVSAACNPRIWSVTWIAVSAAAEIFIYLVLALATVFVAIIINIYEGSRRDVRPEEAAQPERTPTPKEDLLRTAPSADNQNKSVKISSVS